MISSEILQTAQNAASNRQQGHGTSWMFGILRMSPEFERTLATMASIPGYRENLQNADGSFAFRPSDDGTRVAGRFGIDSFGRFVTI